MRVLYHPKRHILGFEPYVAPENFNREDQPVDIYEVFEKYYRSHRTAKWIYSVANAATTTKPHGGTSYHYGYELGGISYTADLAEGDTITWDGSATKRWVIALHTTMTMMTCLVQTEGPVLNYNAGAEWLYCGNLINSVVTGNSTAESTTVKWIHIHRLNNITTYAYCCHYGDVSLSGKLYLSETATVIGAISFGRCSGLSGVLVIPDNYTEIGNGAFGNCGAAFSGGVIFSSNLTIIGSEAFWATTLGGTLDFPDSLTTIGYWAFYNSTGVSGDLVIKSSVTSIGYAAFANINFGSLTNNSSNFEIYDYCLYDVSGGRCWSLYGLKSHSGTLTIKPGTTKIQQQTFSSNTNRTGSIIILNTITEIQDGGFYGMSSMTGTFTFESTSVCTKIGMRGLSGGKWTGAIALPDSMKTFDYGALESCNGFTSLSFGSGMITIGERSCSGLTGITDTDLTIPNSVTYIGLATFWSGRWTGTLTIGSGVTTIDYAAFIDNRFTSIVSNAANYPVNDNILYDEKTVGQVKVINGAYGIVGVLKIKSTTTHILWGADLGGPNVTMYYCYPSTAPSVANNDVFRDYAKVLHIPASNSGYNIAPWTNTSKFSSIAQDL
jgi:hypothetical protein